MQTSNRPGSVVSGARLGPCACVSSPCGGQVTQSGSEKGACQTPPRAEGRALTPGRQPCRRAQLRPSHWWAPQPPGMLGTSPGVSAPHPWLTPQPPPMALLQDLSPTQPHPHPGPCEPTAPRNIRQAGRRRRLGRATDIGAGGLPCPQVAHHRPPPGVRGSPAPQGGALPGPSAARGRGKKAWTVVPSARVLLKNSSSFGGRAGAGQQLPQPPVAQGPPAWQPAPRNSVPLGPSHGPNLTVDSASDRARQPPSPDLTSTSPQSVPPRPCPGHPSPQPAPVAKPTPGTPQMRACPAASAQE